MQTDEAPPKKKRAKKVVIPRREPSLVVPERKIVYPSPDKTTCAECPCFPKESPYRKPPKLRACLTSPPTLYELTAPMVDRLKFPEAFHWSVEETADWIAEEVGLPEYKECIMDNKINGRRLLMLEGASHLPPMGVRSMEHIQRITSKVHQLFGTEFVRFSRSVGLPYRYPLTHCTWFKSRTGPTWGIRLNWTRYHKPDFPKVKFARIPKRDKVDDIPCYMPKEVSDEILVPRKFILEAHIPTERQLIWTQKRHYPPLFPEKPKKVPKPSRLVPTPVKLKGLKGKQLILARRKMGKPKFLPS